MTPAAIRWDETPGHGKGGETPGATPGVSTRMWDATPGHATPGAVTPGRETPSHEKVVSSRRNRWDETPKTERGLCYKLCYFLAYFTNCKMIGICIAIMKIYYIAAKSNLFIFEYFNFHHLIIIRIYKYTNLNNNIALNNIVIIIYIALKFIEL